MTSTHALIEPLESRIAPATLVTPTTVTYTDVDGDAVTVKTTKGAFDLADFTFMDSGMGQILQYLNLVNKTQFAGAAISVTSTPAGGGNGFVDVGVIDATNVDLKSVTVDGDLSSANAGDGVAYTQGLGSLSVRSLGVANIGNELSTIFGKLGKLSVTGSVDGATVNVGGGQYGQIGSVSIGGDLLGGGFADTGSLIADGSIGPVKITGNLTGGNGIRSGSIDSGGNLGAVTVGGSILGGVGAQSGAIKAEGTITSVTTDFLTGNDGFQSGSIRTIGGGNIKTVTITNDVIGGSGEESGTIRTIDGGNIGTVKISGNMTGNDGQRSGSIQTNNGGGITSVTIGGTVTGGVGIASGNIETDNGGNITSVKITGDLVGGGGENSGNIRTADLGSINSVTVGGTVTGSSGVGSGSIYVSEAGNIGTVKITQSLTGGGGVNSGSIIAASGGSISAITIGVKLQGGVGSESGFITTNEVGNIGSIKIGSNTPGDGIFGGGGVHSGGIDCDEGSITSITVNGEILGGAGLLSGRIRSDISIGTVKISGNLTGGTSSQSGLIIVENGDLKTVTIGGSLIGGSGSISGVIKVPFGTIGSLTIGQNLTGGSSVTFLDQSGYVSAQNLTKVIIKGDLTAGTAASAGQVTRSGSIQASNSLGSLTVGGEIKGDVTTPVLISARGQTAPTTTTDLAINSIKVTKGVSFASIIAGLETNGNFTNPDAQIGKVTVGKDWTGSSIAAGINPDIMGVTAVDYFGDADDASAGASGRDVATIISKIASVTIGGNVTDTVDALDHYGIVAEHVVSVKIAGILVSQLAGASNDLTPGVAVTGTTDFNVMEVV